MYDFTKFKNKIKEAEAWLSKEFGSIRTGRASPAILDTIKVDSYGALVPISQVGSISTEDPRTMRIIPWDLSQAKNIEKAIAVSNLGVSVTVDDKGLRVIFPALTEERRKEIVKIAKQKLEDGKVRVRSAREETIKEIEKKEKEGGVGEDDVKRFKTELQKMVDAANKSFDDLFAKKEKEIIS
jgi:ribosome recycling factor